MARPDVFLLAGQSNMSGRGELADLTAAERTADLAITVYGNDDRSHVALDPLDVATDQVDAVSADENAAVGPGLFFARVVHAARGRPVILVPCAKGGSAIDAWHASDSRSTLYGSCLTRALAVGNVSGVLWYQGESDAEKPAREADRWTRSFAALQADLRRDLNRKDLPVVLVELADRPNPDRDAVRFGSWKRIQKQQRRYHAQCAATVSARGLSLKSDSLHLDTSGQRALGTRLAAAMLPLLDRCGNRGVARADARRSVPTIVQRLGD